MSVAGQERKEIVRISGGVGGMGGGGGTCGTPKNLTPFFFSFFFFF